MTLVVRTITAIISTACVKCAFRIVVGVERMRADTSSACCLCACVCAVLVCVHSRKLLSARRMFSVTSQHIRYRSRAIDTLMWTHKRRQIVKRNCG